MTVNLSSSASPKIVKPVSATTTLSLTCTQILRLRVDVDVVEGAGMGQLTPVTVTKTPLDGSGVELPITSSDRRQQFRLGRIFDLPRRITKADLTARRLAVRLLVTASPDRAQIADLAPGTEIAAVPPMSAERLAPIAATKIRRGRLISGAASRAITAREYARLYKRCSADLYLNPFAIGGKLDFGSPRARARVEEVTGPGTLAPRVDYVYELSAGTRLCAIVEEPRAGVGRRLYSPTLSTASWGYLAISKSTAQGAVRIFTTRRSGKQSE